MNSITKAFCTQLKAKYLVLVLNLLTRGNNEWRVKVEELISCTSDLGFILCTFNFILDQMHFSLLFYHSAWMDSNEIFSQFFYLLSDKIFDVDRVRWTRQSHHKSRPFFFLFFSVTHFFKYSLYLCYICLYCLHLLLFIKAI